MSTVIADNQAHEFEYNEYYDAGFVVFPLHPMINGKCSCYDPKCEAHGKHPMTAGYTKLQYMTKSDFERATSTRDTGANRFDSGFGVLMDNRKEPGIKNLVIDSDPRNGGAESLARLLEDVPALGQAGLIVNTGRGDGGKHYYFTVPKELKLKGSHAKYPGIDFKTSGQVVGAGSLHQSGNRYKIALGSPSEVTPAPAELIALLTEAKKPKNESVDSSAFAPVSSDKLQRLLKVLPNPSIAGYDEWLQVGMGIKQEGGCYSDWIAWSEKNQAMHDDSEMQKKWNSFTTDHPDPITYGTLDKYATDWGVAAFDLLDDAGKKELIQSFDDEEKDDSHKGKPEFELPPLPVELSYLPGDLGAIQRYVHGSMVYPCMYTAGWVALTTYSALAQTKTTIDSRGGLGLNEYFLTLAPTGFGKEEMRDPPRALIKGMRHEVGACVPQIVSSAPSSAQGLHVALEEQPDHSIVLQADEFAEWIKGASENSHKHGALSYIMEAYSKSTREIQPGLVMSKDYAPVQNPRVGVFATTTGESFIAATTKTHAEMGAYNRLVIYVANEISCKKRYTGMTYTPSREALDAAKRITTRGHTVLTIAPDGLKEYIEQDQSYAEPVRFVDGLMGGRLSEQAIKMAGLFALSDNRTAINADDMRSGFAIRLGLYGRASALMEQSGAISGAHETTKAMDQIRAALSKGKPVYISALKARSRAYSGLHIQEQNAVIRTLIERGYAVHPDGKKHMLMKPNIAQNK